MEKTIEQIQEDLIGNLVELSTESFKTILQFLRSLAQTDDKT